MLRPKHLTVNLIEETIKESLKRLVDLAEEAVGKLESS
jgi:hypothetical protein